MESGVETRHLRYVRAMAPEKPDEFYLSRQMIGIISTYALQLLEQAVVDQTSPGMLHPMYQPVTYRRQRHGALLFGPTSPASTAACARKITRIHRLAAPLFISLICKR